MTEIDWDAVEANEARLHAGLEPILMPYAEWTGAERYFAERLKDPEYLAGFKEAKRSLYTDPSTGFVTGGLLDECPCQVADNHDEWHRLHTLPCGCHGEFDLEEMRIPDLTPEEIHGFVAAIEDKRCGACQRSSHDHCWGEWTAGICFCPDPECTERRQHDVDESERPE